MGPLTFTLTSPSSPSPSPRFPSFATFGGLKKDSVFLFAMKFDQKNQLYLVDLPGGILVDLYNVDIFPPKKRLKKVISGSWPARVSPADVFSRQ